MTATHGETGGSLAHHWTAVLAEYWRQTDWDQFQAQKSRAETFGERVQVATRAADVHDALDKLARGLNMASPELPTANLQPLVEHDEAALRTLRREHIYLVNKADEAVQNFFKAMGGDGDEDGGAEPTTTDLSDFITTGADTEDDQ